MMPGRDPAAGAAHENAQQHLPWLLNGRLDDADRQALEAHLRDCPACRLDLDRLRRMREAAAAPEPRCDPDRAFARLLPRLEPPSQPQPPPPLAAQRARRPAAANDARWLRWAALLQCCVIVVLAALLVQRDPAGDRYRALGSAPTALGQVVVLFRPETPERELRRIVRASGARIVDGPTVTDAYVVGIDRAQAAQLLARLRAEPAVLLAEPLSAGEPP